MKVQTCQIQSLLIKFMVISVFYCLLLQEEDHQDPQQHADPTILVCHEVQDNTLVGEHSVPIVGLNRLVFLRLPSKAP